MNRISQKLTFIVSFFLVTISALQAQIPQQIEPSGPKAEESFTDSPWLYVAIGGIILLIIIFYAAKKRADRKRREELNDTK
ncbi:hypothetical protein [Halocola ammonii]